MSEVSGFVYYKLLKGSSVIYRRDKHDPDGWLDTRTHIDEKWGYSGYNIVSFKEAFREMIIEISEEEAFLDLM